MPAIITRIKVTVPTHISQVITCIFSDGILKHKSLKICMSVREGYLNLLYRACKSFTYENLPPLYNRHVYSARQIKT